MEERINQRSTEIQAFGDVQHLCRHLSGDLSLWWPCCWIAALVRMRAMSRLTPMPGSGTTKDENNQ